MHVVAYDPFVGDERFRELGVERAATLDDVLAAADFLTLHSPLTDETRGMIDRETIAKMRDGARLVNAARGASSTRRRWSRRSAPASWPAPRSTSSRGALQRPAARARQGRRHAAPRRVDRRGAGSGRRDHRRAGRGGARRRSRHERRQHPVVDKADLEVLGPFIPLAARLGRLAVELAGGRPRRIVVAAHGPLADFDTRLLTVAALTASSSGRVDQAVNFVNASLIAAERGSPCRRSGPRLARLHEHRRGAGDADGATRSRSRGRRSGPSRGCSSRARSASGSTSSSRRTWSSSATTTCPA